MHKNGSDVIFGYGLVYCGHFVKLQKCGQNHISHIIYCGRKETLTVRKTLLLDMIIPLSLVP